MYSKDMPNAKLKSQKSKIQVKTQNLKLIIFELYF